MTHREFEIGIAPTLSAGPKALDTTVISQAIVPFALTDVDPDADPDAKELGNQITESLASILSGLPRLRILSRNIVFTVPK